LRGSPLDRVFENLIRSAFSALIVWGEGRRLVTSSPSNGNYFFRLPEVLRERTVPLEFLPSTFLTPLSHGHRFLLDRPILP